MIDGIITLIISVWVLMAVLGLKPFHNQQTNFLRIFSKKVWLVCFSIIFTFSIFEIFVAN
jgi:hypothetical protein